MESANINNTALANVRNVFMEITSRCNMNCKFCPYPVLKREKKDMPREYALKILNELKGKGKDVTFHVMGEPLLNHNFFEYAKICDDYGINYWLVTNGLMLTENICDKLFSLKNLKNLEISFHTFSPDSFKLRGCEMPFDKYVENIKRAVFSKKRYEAGIKINIDIMYDLNILSGNLWRNFTREKWLDFSQILLDWQKRLHTLHPDAQDRYPKFFNGKKKIFYRGDNYLYRRYEDIPKNIFADLPEHIQWLRWEIFPEVFVTLKKFFFFTKNSAYLSNTIANGMEFEVEEATNFNCSWPGDLAILSNGQITFCCLDYEGELSCGNIAEMTLEEAASSKCRKTVLSQPDQFKVCRLCRGNITIK